MSIPSIDKRFIVWQKTDIPHFVDGDHELLQQLKAESRQFLIGIRGEYWPMRNKTWIFVLPDVTTERIDHFHIITIYNYYL